MNKKLDIEPLLTVTLEEEKEFDKTATQILAWMHDFEDEEKAYLLSKVLKKFERTSKIKREVVITDSSFLIEEDMIQKDLNPRKELSL